MTTKPLAGKKIAIMVANGFDEIEFTEPQKQLIEAGANVKTVSRANGLVNGWYEGAWGHFYPVDGDLAETLAIDFDGLVIPGGTRNVEKLASDPHGVRILNAFLRADMPICLIGDATSMLATVGAAEGRAVTGSASAKDAVVEAGGTWDEASFLIENNLATAAGSEGLNEMLQGFMEMVAAYQGEVNEAA